MERLRNIRVRFSAGEKFDVFAVQGDTLTRGFRATLINPETNEVITPDESYTFQLVAKRTPEEYIVTEGTIEGDRYIVYLSTNMLIEPGPLELQLVLKDGESVIRSAPWTINIPKALDIDGLPIQGQDIIVDYTELRAQMTSFEERAAIYEALSSGSWTLIMGRCTASSPGRDVPFRKNLTTKSGYGSCTWTLLQQRQADLRLLFRQKRQGAKDDRVSIIRCRKLWMDEGDIEYRRKG